MIPSSYLQTASAPPWLGSSGPFQRDAAEIANHGSNTSRREWLLTPGVRVVSFSRPYLQIRLLHLHHELVVFSIVPVFGRREGQHILRTQFLLDLREDLSWTTMRRRKLLAAGFLREPAH